MKYECIATQVEATQYLPGKEVPGVFKEDNTENYYVVTIQNEKVPIHYGEWVITEEDGIHHYPCSDAIFQKKYKLVSGQTEKVLVKEKALKREKKLVHSGTVREATKNTIVLDIDDKFDCKGTFISVNAGGSIQSRNIISYDSTTKVAIIDRNWDNIPGTNSVYKIEAVVYKEDKVIEAKAIEAKAIEAKAIEAKKIEEAKKAIEAKKVQEASKAK